MNCNNIPRSRHNCESSRRFSKSKILLAFLAAQCASIATHSVAKAVATNVSAPAAVERPLGQAAAFLEGGTAVTTDLSAVDYNPAGIAIGKVLSVEGATSWQKDNIQSTEIGVIDSAMAEVAAALKFRQSSSAVGPMQRRVSLAVADEVGVKGLLVGIAGDFKERPDFNEIGKITGETQEYELRAGVVYNFNPQFRSGFRTSGYFDDTVPTEHALGLGALLGQHFVVNGDVVFEEEDPLKTTAGVGVLFKEFFDVRLGYGYLIDESVHQGTAGLFLVSPKAAVYYIAAVEDLAVRDLEHQIGVRLNLSF